MLADTPIDKFHIETTRRMCLDDPRKAAIRDALLDIERKGHATGWDGPNAGARLMQLDLHRDEPRAEVTWSKGFNDVFEAFVEQLNGHVGKGITATVRHLENCAEFARTDRIPDAWMIYPPHIIETLRATSANMNVARLAANGDDLVGALNKKPGFRFHGCGMRAEAWVPAKVNAEAIQAFKRNTLDEYEGRLEVRTVWLLDRDGYTWCVTRVRGAQPSVMALPREAAVKVVSAIPDSLRRLTDVITNNHQSNQPR